jgi:hypothetical protein
MLVAETAASELGTEYTQTAGPIFSRRGAEEQGGFEPKRCSSNFYVAHPFWTQGCKL